MGANAQTTVPTFTASQVLTADQMNQSARTGVPVFASTGTRDAAFDGSGEKTLAEGQFCYVEGTGFQTYNGTAWVTWGTSLTSGLNLISNTTIGTTVSSVTVSNAFSATYDNYRIILSGGVASTDTGLNMTLGATATGYYWAYTGRSFAGVAATSQGANDTAWKTIGTSSTATSHMVIDLCSPYLAKNTVVSGMNIYASTSGSQYEYGGVLSNTTSYTAFTLTPQTGTLTGGTIQVFGYKN